jgi:hypothetical protein
VGSANLAKTHRALRLLKELDPEQCGPALAVGPAQTPLRGSFQGMVAMRDKDPLLHLLIDFFSLPPHTLPETFHRTYFPPGIR